MQAASVSMSRSAIRSLHLAGACLALAGAVFVAVKLHGYWRGLDLSGIGALEWACIGLLSVVYGLANFLLALAWRHILCHSGVRITEVTAIKIYGMSHLAKYVPGNIFQFAGRQALGMAAGLAAGILAGSMVWELGLIALAGALFGWLILPVLLPAFPGAGSVFLLICSVAFLAYLLRSIFDVHLMWSFILQLVFLSVSGLTFILLAGMIADRQGISVDGWMVIGGSYIVAWLAGLVTPGAPAGVGVREMVLIFLLAGLLTETDLLKVVLFGRLVTIIGDVFFFAAASLLRDKEHDFSKNHI